jgi:hypothetical protein
MYVCRSTKDLQEKIIANKLSSLLVGAAITGCHNENTTLLPAKICCSEMRRKEEHSIRRPPMFWIAKNGEMCVIYVID